MTTHAKATRDAFGLLAGAYIAWELHIGSHYCKAASGEGQCDAGHEILRRLHTAYYALTDEQRREALETVRDWDWEDEAPYDNAT
jgi:hypothetical protein